VIPINDKQSLRDKINERPRFYTGIAVIASVFLLSATYGFYNAEISELEVDVSSGHDDSTSAQLLIETTENFQVTPYTATYTAVHGCDYIETPPGQKIEDCKIKPLGAVMG